MSNVISIFCNKKVNLLTSKKSGYDSGKMKGNVTPKNTLSFEDRNYLRQLFEVKTCH